MAGFNDKWNVKAADLILGAYLLLTAVYMLVFDGLSSLVILHLQIRLVLLLFIVLIIVLNARFNGKLINFVHLFYPIILLSYLYGETASINHLLFAENLDVHVYDWEQFVFGFQPSLEFSRSFPQKWFSELLHFGYFSYYLLTAGIALAFYFYKPALSERIIFLVFTSFLIYYFIFILFPVVGPQYYFQAPLSQMSDSGIFSRAVKLVQYYGEHPTGAFPSSHVGMVVIFLSLSFKSIRWFFWLVMPLFLLIMLATVYIKAHYTVDVFAGLLSAPFVLYLSKLLYGKLSQLLSVKNDDGLQ